jgi:hypothetical protein
MSSQAVRRRSEFREKLLAGMPVTAGEISDNVPGWPTQRMRRWLKRTGAGEVRGNRVVTTMPKLTAHFPELANALVLFAIGSSRDE